MSGVTTVSRPEPLPALLPHEPVPLPRRIGARALDCVLVFLLPPAQVIMLTRSTVAGLLLPLAFSLVIVAVVVTQSATPGQTMMGMRHVDVRSGRPSGGRTAVKYLLQGLAGALSLCVLPVVALAQAQPPFRRTWFDERTGLALIERAAPGSAPRTAPPGTQVATPTFAPPAAPAAPAAPAVPVAPGVPGAPSVLAAPSAPADPATSVDRPAVATVLLDNGTQIAVTDPVVLGRDPVAPPSHPHARPVPVADAERSISKTHVLLAPAPGGVWVLDLHSTNGVRVLAGATGVRTLDPAVPALVAGGTVVEYGERRFEVAG